MNFFKDTTIMTMTRIFLAACCLVLTAGAAEARLRVTDKTIIRKGKLTLDIHYPHTGRAAIDAIFARAARELAADPDLHATADGANTGSMGYEIRRNDDAMFSLEVWTSRYYAGHAHGTPGFSTYNFLMPEGADLQIGDLVDNTKGMARLHALVVADLKRQMKSPNDTFGLKPREGSFSQFIWLADRLEVIYPPYTVAGYAQGTFHVSIPFTSLQGVLRPDPRIPMPSFDCQAARSAIEHTICADAALARMDRLLAQDFAARRGFHTVRPAKPNETERERQRRAIAQSYLDKTLAGQQGWLASRDKDCATGSRTCLKAHYAAGLKANF
jgi:uncharacterized protein YecT (DUF1311 family)